MRKAAAILLLLPLLAVTAAGILAADIFALKDQVTFTEHTAAGESSAADGLTVRMSADYNRHQVWNTSHSFGNPPTPQTEYSFHAKQIDTPYEEEYLGVYIDMDPFSGVRFDPDEPQTGVGKAMAELYAQTQPGEEKETTIRLKDYIEFYNFDIQLDFPNLRFFLGANDKKDDMAEWYANGIATAEYLWNYLKIPVLEDETLNIHVRRNENGLLSNSGWGSAGSDRFRMWLDNIVTSDACYFTFDPHSSDGNLVDLSHLPDGFGIFRLPYRDAQEEGWPRTISVLDYEALDMVYPLDPEAYLFSMHTDAEETQLILHTLENDRYMLTVIDLDTMATLQKLDLTARPQYFGEPVVGEDFIITAMYTEDQRQALVLARTAEGLYEMAYLCPLEHDDLSSATVVSEAMSFDGERLAVAGFLRVKREGYASVETCDYSLAVYDKSGLLYCAEFDSSLDSGYNEKRYEFFCMPFGYPPIQLEWDKS